MELRTPLHGIIGLTESLLNKEYGKITETQQRHLQLINQSSKRLTGLVNDILDFSKMKNQDLSVEAKPLHVRSIVDMVLELDRGMIQNESLRLENDVGDQFFVIADESRFMQIMHNLVGNAIKFSEKGAISIFANEQQGFLLISVTDQGIGIAQDDLQRIFHPFEQGDGSSRRAYSGTGLGLSISKKLAELQGGSLSASSILGVGSTFYLTLPLAKSEMADISRAKPKNTLKRYDFTRRLTVQIDPPESLEIQSPNLERLEKPSGFSILAVDDDMTNLEVLRTQLEREGHSVLMAHGGQGSLEVIVSGQKVDLVLLDIMMPKMNGLDVCRELRKKFGPSELPIIFLSAKAQEQAVVLGLSAGANDFLPKPFSQQELSARIANLLKLKSLTQKWADRISHDEAAKAVQMSLIPPDFFDDGTFSLRAIYLPAERLGGDWYTYFSLPNRDEFLVLIGDVTGHGVGSALLAAVVAGATDALLSDGGQLPIDQLLKNLVHRLNEVVHRSGHKSGLCMTLSVAAINRVNGLVQYINAGHTRFIHVLGGKPSLAKGGGFFLGFGPGEQVLRQVQMQPGDMILFYTDGLLENGMDLGAARLQMREIYALLDGQNLNPEDVIHRLHQNLQEVWKESPAADDCTLVAPTWSGKRAG